MACYLIRAGLTGPCKLGKADDPKRRLMELQTAHYEALHLLRVWEGGVAEEAALHQRFADLHIRGEWFSFSKAMLADVGLRPLPPAPTAWRFIPSGATDPTPTPAQSHYTPEMRATCSERMKAQWSDPERRADRLGKYRATLASKLDPAQARRREEEAERQAAIEEGLRIIAARKAVA